MLILAKMFKKKQDIMTERCKTLTILGQGNASGHQIPPAFVFLGVRLSPGLLEGKTHGANSIMTKSGWSKVFKYYHQNHFLKFAKGRDASDRLLLFYDGRRSHISLDLIKWAKEKNIVLFCSSPTYFSHPATHGCGLFWATACALQSRMYTIC